MKQNKFKWPLIISLIVIIGFLSFKMNNQAEKEKDLGVSLDNELLKYFMEKQPDNQVLKCGYEDVDGDGRKDLVVIYKIADRSNGMTVILNKEEGYEMTKEVPAPIENQTIEFKDIDDEPPMEFIVSGSKDGRYGYAIFRVEGLETKDLFGEGMEDCC